MDEQQEKITPVPTNQSADKNEVKPTLERKMTRGQFLRTATIALLGIALVGEETRKLGIVAGAAVGVEVPNPFTKTATRVGVTVLNRDAASTYILPAEMTYPKGGKERFNVFKVQVGEPSTELYVETLLDPKDSATIKQARIFAGANAGIPK